MTINKLSPLAQELFDKLNAHSHIFSIEAAAMVCAFDENIAQNRAHQLAYLEIYEYCQTDF